MCILKLRKLSSRCRIWFFKTMWKTRKPVSYNFDMNGVLKMGKISWINQKLNFVYHINNCWIYYCSFFRNGCKPIYFSFTPTQYPVGGQTGLDCSSNRHNFLGVTDHVLIMPFSFYNIVEGCQFPNQVKVTFTHWDMRCNGAYRNLISLPMALATLIISFFFSNKTT